ncbi:pyrimidine dimer DNA glycosylase/endonuclease V [Castellaniella ginsengisoli]|jgi:deoxyribonuclease (pyrimidine dimer)|uniref:Pyrimidine dimer DNA glycosylase/endonuclease V n=1 Tax=Castellaniella ginsengisoli TaxID=546114 RepID=A0AB39ELN8_9BURK
MTRINCIPVDELSGPHLVAEYRELPRVFGLALKAASKGTLDAPDRYTLGKGHMRFFYVRLGYLARRHQALVAEMRRRGYQPRFEGIVRADFPDIPDVCWNDWTPPPEAQALNRARIAERLGAAAGGSRA